MLNREIFDTLLEVRVLLKRWRWEYSWIRPHSFLGYRPLAPEAILTGKLSLIDFSIRVTPV
ncbi:MAG: transposase [Acidobacteria bacterium]|nr:transposase [Acidobacteriota bacterium]MBU4495160.1 transposase [Acidobacteriota bacterium]